MIELLWLGTSVIAGVVTLGNLGGSFGRWRILRRNGPARREVARANLGSDAFLLASAIGCIVIVLPSLGREGDIALSPYVVAAMLIPVGIACASILGAWTRRRVDRLVAMNGS